MGASCSSVAHIGSNGQAPPCCVCKADGRSAKALYCCSDPSCSYLVCERHSHIHSDLRKHKMERLHTLSSPCIVCEDDGKKIWSSHTCNTCQIDFCERHAKIHNKDFQHDLVPVAVKPRSPVNPHLHPQTQQTQQAAESTRIVAPHSSHQTPKSHSHSHGAKSIGMDGSTVPRIFISLRFGESIGESKALHKALTDRGIPTFLCNENVGNDVAAIIYSAMENAQLIIIMGSLTYGTDTGAGFSTYEEFQFILDEKKPFFLVKLCERWEQPHVRGRFGNRTLYKYWEPGSPMPDGMIDEIVEKLEEVSTQPDEGSSASKILPVPCQSNEINVLITANPDSYEFKKQLLDRVNELGFVWNEQVIEGADHEKVEALVADGKEPDLIWVSGFPRDFIGEKGLHPEYLSVTTSNSNILYYMNGVRFIGRRNSPGAANVRRFAMEFDDVEKAQKNQLTRATLGQEYKLDLEAKHMVAIKAVRSGDIERALSVCHTQSNYRREEHQTEFRQNSDAAYRIRGYLVAAWGGSGIAVCPGLTSLDFSHQVGVTDALSVWLMEEGEWRLMCVTQDPVTTETSGLRSISDWLAEYAATTKNDNTEDIAVVKATNLRFEEAKEGERFGNYKWDLTYSINDNASVGLIAEFHYGSEARLFFLKGDEREVSAGSLWSSSSMWTLRIWTVVGGCVAISEPLDFQN